MCRMKQTLQASSENSHFLMLSKRWRQICPLQRSEPTTGGVLLLLRASQLERLQQAEDQQKKIVRRNHPDKGTLGVTRLSTLTRATERNVSSQVPPGSRIRKQNMRELFVGSSTRQDRSPINARMDSCSIHLLPCHTGHQLAEAFGHKTVKDVRCSPSRLLLRFYIRARDLHSLSLTGRLPLRTHRRSCV